MLDKRAVYICTVCGSEKYVDARAALSNKTLFCCGVSMVKKRQGVIRKNVR